MSNLQIGGTLYIGCKDCKVLRKPNSQDVSPVVTVLQPGAAVKWLGAAPEDRSFQKIQYNGQIGFVLAQSLLTSRPQAQDFNYYCARCNGTGQVGVQWGGSYGFQTCPECKGSGGPYSMRRQAFESHGGTRG